MLVGFDEPQKSRLLAGDMGRKVEIDWGGQLLINERRGAGADNEVAKRHAELIDEAAVE